MVMPTEYGVLTVGVWLAVAAGIGLYALISALRRQTVPMTPSVVAFSMAAGGIWFFPDVYMDYSAITILNIFTMFIIVDLFVISLVLRFRKSSSKA
ncbi:hypothetical protein [Deinococcus marmoris]|uniref:hypothetical protein n=1 Tax=Deinococcus marmoris TaxID=249408 RepID=UPI00096ACA19|nr:hypothetical protein [Deinococcus marmoris]